MLEHKNSLINQMVTICKDYENDTFNFFHVSEWIEQFPDEHQITILSNLVNILKKTYYSKQKIEKILPSCLNIKNNFPQSIDQYGFLDIQEKGGSQKELLKILVEKSEHLINIVKYEEIGSGDYIYLDDGFYSGNTLYRDIKRWIEEIDISKVNSLTIIYLGYHKRQHNYIIEKKLKKELLPDKKIRIRYDTMFIDENVSAIQYDSFLPPDMEYNESTKDYIKEIMDGRSEQQNRFYPIIRNKERELNDDYFLSHDDRLLIESIFLEKGVEIYQNNVNNSNFRPMGYDSNKTLGFGSFFITYRNIPNNCPLVLWWGDEDKEYLGDWKPLFTRIANNNF